MTFLQRCVVLALLAVLSRADEIADELADYRLNTNIRPSIYNISLKPYLRDDDGDKQFTFDGEVFIQFETKKVGVATIFLHSKNLTYLKEAKLYETLIEQNIIQTTNTTNATTDKLLLNTMSSLKPNTNYTLHFVYRGYMNDDMHGFYRSNYQDANGNTKWLGSTQFQTHHARKAFPCFDEPLFKAIFYVRINRHKGFNTVSNTEIETVLKAPEENRYIDVYTPTPRMSTYLLAFLVSDFVSRQNLDGDFFVVARPEFYSQTEFAHIVGPKLLEGFGNLTLLPYNKIGNIKMHLAAIPDFSAGAMENWGLLTYRERAVLYDEDSSSLSSKQSIASIISHEQAHMWFGDLVTCEWWSWTWLNEGFARYFQYFMTHQIHPELEMDKQFVVDQIQTVFSMDSTNNTNPMSDLDTNTPSDLSRMFNSISYNKGGTIIRMIRHAMGEESFIKSLQQYLLENSHNNTRPENLFKHWKSNWGSVDVDLDTLFREWTEQVGYPVITVNVSQIDSKMSLQQKRFLINQNDSDSDNTLLYTIPFSYTTDIEMNFANTTPKLYISNTPTAMNVSIINNTNWVVANIQQTGYYRVNYNQENWHAIHKALTLTNYSGIHELNRAQIVDDLLNLARAGVIEYELAFQCLEYLTNELNYLPWKSALNGLTYLAIRLGVENKPSFGSYILYIINNAYKQLGFNERENDTTLEIYNRNNILSWGCKYGNEDCITNSKKIFNNLIENRVPIPVNIRSAVYCSAMREGEQKDFDVLFEKFKKETVATEQTQLISALGCVKKVELVEHFFNIILTDSIRRQDKSAALSSLYSENPENVEPVFDLVTKKCDELAEAMGSLADVANVIANIASRFTKEEQRVNLTSFIDENVDKFGTSISILRRAEVSVRDNIEWSRERLSSVINYLNTKRGAAAANSINVILVAFLAICSFIYTNIL